MLRYYQVPKLACHCNITRRYAYPVEKEPEKPTPARDWPTSGAAVVRSKNGKEGTLELLQSRMDSYHDRWLVKPT